MLMRKEQAASYLGISVRTLQRLMTANKMAFQVEPTPRGGEVAVFDQAELDRYLSEKNTALRSPVLVNPPSSTAIISPEMIASLFDRLVFATKPAPALMLTLRQASNWSGLPRKFLREAIERGELRSIEIGKSSRIPADALRSFTRRLAGG